MTLKGKMGIFTRTVFLVGLTFLLLALSGFVFLSTRSFPRKILVSNIPAEDLMLPIITPSPTPSLTPTDTPSSSSTSTTTPTGTSTPSPTNTSTSTPTPTPEAVVLAFGLNLRSGPGTVYDPPIGYLKNGQILDVRGRVPDNKWIQVIPVDRNIVGWVYAAPEYVQLNVDLNTIPIVEIPPTPTPTPTPTSSYQYEFGPNLYEPKSWTSYPVGEKVRFTWQRFDLKPDQYYSVRVVLDVSEGEPEPEACIHIQAQNPQDPSKDPEVILKLDCPPGSYYWSVVVAAKLPEGSEHEWRGDTEENYVNQFGIGMPHENTPSGGDGGSGDGSVSINGDPGYLPALPKTTPTDTPSPSPTPSPTPADTPSPSPTPSPTPTDTPSPSPTLSPTPTNTLSPSPIPILSPTLTPTLTPILTPTLTLLPSEVIEVEWPQKMEIDCSNSIRVSIVRISGQTFVVTVERPGNTVVAATIRPIGTPNAPIEHAFGPEYRGFAVANLAGAAFEVEPLTTERQPLEQPEITWVWNIMSKKPGEQVVNVNIKAEWEPIDSNGQTIQREVWRSGLEVLVEEPFIATGQLNILTLVSGFIGSALSAPWIYAKIVEAREKRGKGERDKPKIEIAKR